MNNLADIIVYLLAYTSLAGIDPDDGHTLDCNRADDDAKAMEMVSVMLDSATATEYAALRAAVHRAVALESAPNWIAAYEDVLSDLNEREASKNSFSD